MSPKFKNIILFVGIAVVLVFGYFSFFGKSEPEANLVTALPPALPGAGTAPLAPGINNTLTHDFLSLLLNVKNIHLDDSIFADVSFSNLKDSSITLVQDEPEGRPNPSAPIGEDDVASPLPPTSSGDASDSGSDVPPENSPGSTELTPNPNPVPTPTPNEPKPKVAP